MMYSSRQLTLFLALLLCAATWNVDAFVVPPQVGMSSTTATATAFPTKLAMLQELAMVEDSPLTLAAATVDPTSFFTDILGGVMFTPIILAIPIVAALSVAGLVVWAIVAYANPAEPDD